MQLRKERGDSSQATIDGEMGQTSSVLALQERETALAVNLF